MGIIHVNFHKEMIKTTRFMDEKVKRLVFFCTPFSTALQKNWYRTASLKNKRTACKIFSLSLVQHYRRTDVPYCITEEQTYCMPKKDFSRSVTLHYRRTIVLHAKGSFLLFSSTALQKNKRTACPRKILSFSIVLHYRRTHVLHALGRFYPSQ